MSWQDRPYAHGDYGGDGGSVFRQNPLSWAPTIGTIFGIRVQLHILFIIFIAIELLRAATGAGAGFWWAVRYQLMLFGLVFLHEMGHCFGARSVGGSANRVLMWPLGGLADVAPPHRPGATLLTTAAGPAVNFIGCIVSGLVLVLGTGTLLAVPWNPFHWFPHVSVLHLFARSELFFWVYQFFYVNYILMLFNVCLPVFPLDGGRLFQAICWYRMGYEQSLRLATTVGMVGAVVLGCFGLFVQSFMLIGIAVFGYVTCMQQRRMASVMPAYGDQQYDVSAAYAKPEHRGPGRSEGAWARKQQRLAQEQAEVDRILAKVHAQGLGGLTRKEKKILARATRRQQRQERELGRTDRL